MSWWGRSGLEGDAPMLRKNEASSAMTRFTSAAQDLHQVRNSSRGAGFPFPALHTPIGVNSFGGSVSLKMSLEDPFITTLKAACPWICFVALNAIKITYAQSDASRFFVYLALEFSHEVLKSARSRLGHHQNFKFFLGECNCDALDAKANAAIFAIKSKRFSEAFDPYSQRW